MKLCMESDHDRNQRPLRPTRWFLFLGILQIGMDLDRKKKSSKVLILYTVRKLIKNWANISKIVGSENGLVTSYSRLQILEIRLLTINVHNKSEFYEEIFLLSHTDLFILLFVLVSLRGKSLINIQKLETNSSLVLIYQTVFQTLRGPSLSDIWSELSPQQKRIYIDYT